jgi:hypothetical protein
MKEYLTPDRIANQLRMIRVNPAYQFCSFLIVEGSTDEKFYKQLVNNEKCQIIIAHLKDNARNVLLILEKDRFLGVLAIVDADFEVLEGSLPASPDLLFTDTHDLETMILRSPALEKVLSEFASKDKCTTFETKSGKDLRTILLECGKYLGYLRWISLREDLSLKFEELSFEKFIDKEALTITDILKLIRIIQSKSHNTDRGKLHQRPLEDNDIHDKMIQLYDEIHDLWHVCCGHDLICILSFGLRKAIGSTKTIDPELLESCLRLAYEPTYFFKTRLYAAIQKWEKANMPFIILISQNV